MFVTQAVNSHYLGMYSMSDHTGDTWELSSSISGAVIECLRVVLYKEKKINPLLVLDAVQFKNSAPAICSVSQAFMLHKTMTRASGDLQKRVNIEGWSHFTELVSQDITNPVP